MQILIRIGLVIYIILIYLFNIKQYFINLEMAFINP